MPVKVPKSALIDGFDSVVGQFGCIQQNCRRSEVRTSTDRMPKLQVMSLSVIVLSLIGCTKGTTYSGNQRPTSYKAVPGRNAHDQWEWSLFITPDQVIERCGEPSSTRITGSSKSDSEYSLDQTHLVYSEKKVEVLISRYPNARNIKDRS